MGNKNLIRRSIFKEKISELKSKKFSFEINRIELPNGPEGEYGYIKHPGAALAVPITKDNKVIILRQYRFAVSRYLLDHFESSTFLIFWLLLKISESGVITKFRFMNLG